MAFDITSVFRKYPFRFSALALVGIVLTATTTQAGFEWVPAPKKEKAVEAMPQVQAAPPATVMSAPAPDDQMLSPMPLSETEMNAAPAQVLSAPEPEAPVIHTKTFTPDTAASAQVRMDTGLVDDAPMMAEEMPVAPAPITIKRHVVMPDDAPSSARDQIPAEESVTINAAPVMDAPVMNAPAPQTLIAPETAAPVMAEEAAPEAPAPVMEMPAADTPAAPVVYATVEGFGSDVPLALALRDIVPEGFAYSFGLGVNPGSPVSWNGGKPWPEIIDEMIAPLGLRTQITGQVVMIRSNTQGAAMPQDTEMAPAAEMAQQGAVEPASGKDGIKAEEEFSADMYSIRRQIINDPGSQAAEQPPETLDMIKELGLADAPAATDAQAMEAEEKKALAAPMPITAEQEPSNDELVAVAEVSSAVPAPQAAAPSPVPTNVRSLWEAQKGDSLKRTLDDWSKKAGFELVWDSSHDYTIDSDILVTGDFQRAIKAVFSQGLDASQAPLMTFVDQTSAEAQGKVIIQDGQKG